MHGLRAGGSVSAFYALSLIVFFKVRNLNFNEQLAQANCSLRSYISANLYKYIYEPRIKGPTILQDPQKVHFIPAFFPTRCVCVCVLSKRTILYIYNLYRFKKTILQLGTVVTNIQNPTNKPPKGIARTLPIFNQASSIPKLCSRKQLIDSSR